MNGVPCDVDWSPLVGSECSHVDFELGFAALSLYPSNGMEFFARNEFAPYPSIVIYGGFDHVTSAGTHSAPKASPEYAVTLVSLIQSLIESVTPTGPRALSLKFSNSETLVLHDTVERSESFRITVPGTLDVVV